jgi:hypothetical protein
MQPHGCPQKPAEQHSLRLWPLPQLSGSSAQRSPSPTCAHACWQLLVEGWHTSLMQI